MNGVILVKKEKGWTSHDVVAKIKKLFCARVGHTGTLDPNATGVLPILLGEGTKLSKYLMEHDKEYKVCLQLGTKTDTADVEGKIIEEKEILSENWKEDKIEEVLSSFLGKQMQFPPIYSAIKVNGKKLYEYARNQQEVEIQPREIEITSIVLLEIKKEEKQIVFKVECSKGTYIRSLGESIAEELGTVGYVKDLERTRVGKFILEDAITINQIEENRENVEFLKKHIYTPAKIFEDNPNKLVLDAKKISMFSNGVKLSFDLPDGLYNIYYEKEQFIGLGVMKNGILKRDLVL